MSNFIVQKVDEEALAKLAEEMYMNSAYLKQVQAMTARGEMVLFAAEKDGRYVGRCALWLAPADEPELREEIPGIPIVNALEVQEHFRHQGVGTLLMDALEDEAKQRDYRQLALGVEPENKVARIVYEKRGYAYRKMNGVDTYACAWLEVLPDGSEKRNTVRALLMIKELS